MHASNALSQAVRESVNPFSTLEGSANLLVMPDLDTAIISMELTRSLHDALLIGPILSGTERPAHIVTPTATAKGIFNMSALAVSDAWRRQNESTPAGRLQD
jgi:malate dehydrogenase (oxaloacetate-decarboxylating)(NADP+)